MTCPYKVERTGVAIQPALTLVDVFEESVAYERSWKLPFNSLALCVREDPDDPSWCELTERKCRQEYKAGLLSFMTCDTPVRIRYTAGNLHCCIHFRYELFPGVDLFSGIRERRCFEDELLAGRIKAIFAEPEPLCRIAMAQDAAMAAVLKFWPETLPLEPGEMERFSKLFKYIKLHLSSRCSISEMAAVMGWSEGYFLREFHRVFRITPKQYLMRELFARALSELNNPGKTIKEIADAMDFSSEFNFSRFIKNYSGYSPSQLRKSGNGPLYVRK